MHSPAMRRLFKGSIRSAVDALYRDHNCFSTDSLVYKSSSASAPQRTFGFVGSNEWHHSDFLSGASSSEKERWLESLLTKRGYQSVDTEAYLVVLRDLSGCRRPDAPIRAEKWLRRLEDDARSREGTNASTLATPTAECYQCVIKAWANADQESADIAVTRAERWLEESLNHPSESVRPNTASFNAFLDLCTKGRAFKDGNRNLVRLHAEKAQSTVEYMIQQRTSKGNASVAPDADSFNYVIRGWTRCRRSPDIADRTLDALHLFEHYERTVDASVRPDWRSYAMVMDAIAVLARLKANACLNRTEHHNNVSKNGLSELNLLKRILQFITTKSKSSDFAVAPNTHFCNTLIAAWGNISRMHPDAPFEAEKVFWAMADKTDHCQNLVAPDAKSYLMVMRAWMHSQNPKRGERVLWWLSRQWSDFEFDQRENLHPTTTTYNTVIRVLSDIEEPSRAEEILMELMQRAGAMQMDELQANSESFALLIRAWIAVAEKGSKHALRNAVRWLQLLAESERNGANFATSNDLYLSILGASRQCASNSVDVLDQAVRVFEMLRESHHPLSCSHYSRLLQVALLSLSRSEHNKARKAFVLKLVDECCNDGLVSSALVKALANGPVFYDGWTIDESLRLSQDLFPEWPLPGSWMRNIRQVEMLPKQKDLQRTMFDVSTHGFDPYKPIE